MGACKVDIPISFAREKTTAQTVLLRCDVSLALPFPGALLVLAELHVQRADITFCKKGKER